MEPTFWHLAKFIEERALLANTMYGELVGSTTDKDQRNLKLRSKARMGTHYEKVTTMAMQSEVVSGEPLQMTSAFTCPLCSCHHKLSKFEQMKAKSPEERKAFVRQGRL